MSTGDIASAIRFEETAKGGRYFIVMPNGEQSRLTFVKAGAGHIIADHTFVPVPYRGNGVAEAMVERLIADARSRRAEDHADLLVRGRRVRAAPSGLGRCAAAMSVRP